MPLTDFQGKVLAVVSANRSEESHFAGVLVLNADEESPRFSRDRRSALRLWMRRQPGMGWR